MQDAASAVKVGDVVAWRDVPSGAMVREERLNKAPLHTLRIGEWYRVVGGEFGWRPFEPRRQWHEALTLADWVRPPTVTIIALGLTGSESAGDLRRHAEWSERLLAAGWRPGMTAEDAARMLTAHDDAT